MNTPAKLKNYACRMACDSEDKAVIVRASSFERAASIFLDVPSPTKTMGRVKGGYGFSEARGGKRHAIILAAGPDAHLACVEPSPAPIA